VQDHVRRVVLRFPTVAVNRLDAVEAVISCQGLTKRFNALTAVDHLNLIVKRGQVLGLLGPNGAGKTTALRMLLGLVAPSAGSAKVLGFRPGDVRLAGRVGALIEEPAIYPWLSGRENLLVLAETGPTLSHTAVDEALEQVRLSPDPPGR